jgi:hypothetical protein
VVFERAMYLFFGIKIVSLVKIFTGIERL